MRESLSEASQKGLLLKHIHNAFPFFPLSRFRVLPFLYSLSIKHRIFLEVVKSVKMAPLLLLLLLSDRIWQVSRTCLTFTQRYVLYL